MSKETPANKVVKKASKIAMKDIIKPDLSKETLNAEEKALRYLKECGIHSEEIYWDGVTDRIFLHQLLAEFLTNEINAITDEEIKKMFTTEHFSESNGRYYRERVDRITGAKWFKNRLLNG